MSKLGKKPILVNEGVTVVESYGKLAITGPLGSQDVSLPDKIKLEIKGNEILVKRLGNDKQSRAIQGTIVRLIGNAIKGVVENYSKELEIIGTGFRAVMEGNNIVLSLGFSHPVKFIAPEGIKLEVKENKIKVSGISKEKVGQTAHEIREIKKPDPYKGKGIRFLGEILKLKPGKAAAKAGPAAK